MNDGGVVANTIQRRTAAEVGVERRMGLGVPNPLQVFGCHQWRLPRQPQVSHKQVLVIDSPSLFGHQQMVEDMSFERVLADRQTANETPESLQVLFSIGQVVLPLLFGSGLQVGQVGVDKRRVVSQGRFGLGQLVQLGFQQLTVNRIGSEVLLVLLQQFDQARVVGPHNARKQGVLLLDG